MPPRVRARRRSRTPWCRSRRASGPAPHAHLDPCWWPLFFRARRLVVSSDVGAIDEGHAERDAALLGQEQQPLPDAQARPADEGLRRPPPGPKVSRNGPPLGAVLMPPEDSCERAPQILRRGLALGAALLDQRLQPPPLCVRQHRSSSPQEEQTASKPNQFKP